MNRKGIIFLIGFFLLTSAALAATLKVVTQQAMIRKDKRFFSPAVTSVPYGAMIEEKWRDGDWIRVSYQGKEGWIHVSAVKEQKFDLAALAGGQAEEASREEVALAGKGFTPEVEKAFRDGNPKMRYDLVDRIQSYKVQDARMLAFLREGRLQEPGGEK
jgi:hypothetical protein